MITAREAAALAAAAAAGLQVGAATVASRFVVHETGPVQLAFLRYLIAFALFCPFLPLAGRISISRRDLVAVVSLGIAQFGLLIVLLNTGLLFIEAAEATLIFSAFPLLTILIAASLKREALTAAKLAGVLLTILGVALVLPETLLPQDHPFRWAGAAAVLAAALCGAICAVMYRPYLNAYPAIVLASFTTAGAAGFLFVLTVMEALAFGLQAPSSKGWGAVGFIGASSAVGFMLWLWALKHTTPTRVTIFLSLSPVTAALLGAWLLGESLTGGTAASLACVAGGLVLANWPAARIRRKNYDPARRKRSC